MLARCKAFGKMQQNACRVEDAAQTRILVTRLIVEMTLLRKLLFPALVSLPTIVVPIYFFSVYITGIRLSIPFPLPIILVLGPFVVCAAMAMLRPQAKEWRIAALINTLPFFLVIVAGLIGAGR